MFAWNRNGLDLAHKLIDLLLSRFLATAIPLLDLSDEDVFLTFGQFQIIVRELAPFLFQMTFRLFPVPFHLVPIHFYLEVKFLLVGLDGEINLSR